MKQTRSFALPIYLPTMIALPWPLQIAYPSGRIPRVWPGQISLFS
jgi:hypothetical protein